jgi:translation initiation factor IF-3
MARALDLDLVEVAAAANPPVCRIMDYGKYKYEAAQKAKESRRKATNISVKEMKYRPKIGHGDFDTKTRKVEEFLGEGHKVKVTIMFRGARCSIPNSVARS